MSRSKHYLVQQLQASRPLLQPKIASSDGLLKKMLPPQRPIQPLPSNGVVTTAASATTTTFITVASPVNPTVQFIELSRPTVICEEHDSIPQISIPSPAYKPDHDVHDDNLMDEPEEEDGDADDGNVNDAFSLSFLDDNSRSDMEPTSRNMTSTPAHLHIDDHFLDSVLENSNHSLLQTPRRPSPPPSPPGGMNEHSWCQCYKTFLSLPVKARILSPSSWTNLS
jgi:hypothetical protein